MPVNIVKVSFDNEILPARPQRNIPEGRDALGMAKPREWNSARAQELCSIEENHFVDNTEFECRAVQLRARFDEDVEHLAAAKLAQHLA